MEVSGKKSTDVPSASQLHASDDDVRLYCQPCERDGSRVPAYGYCQDCAEHLCKSCYNVHLKPAPLRNHVLLDSSKMPQSQTLTHLPAPTDLTENCPLHSGKVIEYFCRDHNIFGCSPCITMNHRACNIDYIPDASKHYDTSQEYKNLLDTLNNLHTRCKKLAQSAKDNKKKIQDNQNTIKEEIRKFRQKIDHILDNWEAKAVGKVDQLLAEERVRADSIDTESSKSTKEIEDLQNELKESQQSRKLNELFIKAKKNEAKMKDYATTLSQMQDSNYIKNATFKRNLKIERIIKTEKCLGEFIFEKDETSHMKMPSHSHSKGIKREEQQTAQQQVVTDTTKHSASSEPGNVDSQPLLQQPEHKPLIEPVRLQQLAAQQPKLTYDKISATFSGKIDVTVPDDTKLCFIRGIAVISRDTLAVADYQNCKVKLVDTVQNKVVSSLKMSSVPWGVAALPDNQLAVTHPHAGIIQVLSTSGGLSKVRQVKVDGACTGLAYSDGHFVVGFVLPGKVQIMTSEGKVLQTIQYDKGLFLFKKEMFTWPWYVTVDENNKAIYVSDAEGRGITRLNWEGKVTGVYKDSDLCGQHGILVLADGSLLVCYPGYNIIQLVSPDLTTSRKILQEKDELSWPQCVTLDTEQNKLYVGCDSDNSLTLYIMK